MNMVYKVKLSGSYKSGNDIIDYRNLEGYVPYVDYDLAQAMCRVRYARLWLTDNDAYPKRVDSVREVFIDQMKKVDVEKPFSFYGKDILELENNELQDLAVAYDLRRVPLFRDGYSLRETAIIAYVEYNNLILGRKYKFTDAQGKVTEDFLDEKKESFNIQDYPAIIIEGEVGVRDHVTQTNNEDYLAGINNLDDLKSSNKPDSGDEQAVAVAPKGLDIQQLRDVATAKGITFFKGIKYNDLYKKVYGVDPTE